MTFPHTATVSRKTKTGTIYQFGDTGTTVDCFLQPLDMEMAQAYGVTFTKSSTCYLPEDADVLVGDRLRISGVDYSVAGIRTHSYGALAHKKAIVEQA